MASGLKSPEKVADREHEKKLQETDNTLLVELYMGVGIENPINPSTTWGRKEQKNERERERRGLRKS